MKNNNLKECQICGRMGGKFKCMKCGRTVCGSCINRMDSLCKKCSNNNRGPNNFF